MRALSLKSMDAEKMSLPAKSPLKHSSKLLRNVKENGHAILHQLLRISLVFKMLLKVLLSG